VRFNTIGATQQTWVASGGRLRLITNSVRFEQKIEEGNSDANTNYQGFDVIQDCKLTATLNTFMC
jgi:hypothetical protein